MLQDDVCYVDRDCANDVDDVCGASEVDVDDVNDAVGDVDGVCFVDEQLNLVVLWENHSQEHSETTKQCTGACSL